MLSDSRNHYNFQSMSYLFLTNCSDDHRCSLPNRITGNSKMIDPISEANSPIVCFVICQEAVTGRPEALQLY